MIASNWPKEAKPTDVDAILERVHVLVLAENGIYFRRAQTPEKTVTHTTPHLDLYMYLIIWETRNGPEHARFTPSV